MAILFVRQIQPVQPAGTAVERIQAQQLAVGTYIGIMPMLVSLVGACGLRLLWIATIFQLPQFHTIQTIYWSYPISWAITFGVHVICFLWAMKKVKRQLLPEGAPAPVEVPPTLEEETVSE